MLCGREYDRKPAVGTIRRSIHARRASRKSHIPEYEIEALAKCFLPDILDFFESEEGRQEFEKWKGEQVKRIPKEQWRCRFKTRTSIYFFDYALSLRKTTNPNVSPIGKRFGFECFGAGGGTRTHTPSLAKDFESSSSANSNTPAMLYADT